MAFHFKNDMSLIVKLNSILMNIRKLIGDFLVPFVIALVILMLISLSWNYFLKQLYWTIDWKTCFRISLFLAIILPLIRRFNKS